jgi:hypothetical protein
MDQEIAYLKFNFIFPLLKKFISENNLEGWIQNAYSLHFYSHSSHPTYHQRSPQLPNEFPNSSPFEFFSNLFLHSIQNKLSLKISNCIISLDYVLPLNWWPVMLQVKQNPIKAPPWFCIWTYFTLPMPPS